MIKGIGCDIVEIERMKEKCKNEKFMNRVFTKNEQEYISKNSEQTASGIWASKEAVSKALGTGFLKVNYKDIEILHNESGSPYVELHKSANIKFQKMFGKHIHLSISHEEGQALAFVVLE